MIKGRSLLALAGVFFVGAVVGGVAGGYTASKIHRDSAMLALEFRAAAQARVDVAVLQRLSDGRTGQAMQLLEQDLDANVITMSSLLSESLAEVRDDRVTGALLAAAQYRSNNPWSSGDSEIDSHVFEAFRKVTGE